MSIIENKDILILGIETSTHSGGTAITRNGKIAGAVSFNTKKTHSFRQLETIDFLIKELGYSLTDLSAIAVSIGPGSFTGVRIGLSIAKGLAYSASKPIIGISCLESLALRIYEPESILSPVLDANRGEVFAQMFQYDNSEKTVFPYQKSEPFLGSLDQWLNILPENAILAGNAAERYKDEIMKFNKKFSFPPYNRFFSSPEEISILGYKRFIDNKLDDITLLEPIYLRKATNVIPQKNCK